MGDERQRKHEQELQKSTGDGLLFVAVRMIPEDSDANIVYRCFCAAPGKGTEIPIQRPREEMCIKSASGKRLSKGIITFSRYLVGVIAVALAEPNISRGYVLVHIPSPMLLEIRLRHKIHLPWTYS